MTSTILIGDNREVLKTLPAGSVGCCVTSPSYYGLRDYGHDDQIGLEDTPAAYIDELVKVFREVRRVLRNDGTLWINIGDTYAGTRDPKAKQRLNGTDNQVNGSAAARAKIESRRRDGAGVPRSDRVVDGIRAKGMIGIPWRLALALQDDGWILRQDIVWAKPNPMPESVRDRCTKAHEYVFLLVKQRHYFFDSFAIAEVGVTGDRDLARAKITGRGEQAASSAGTGAPQRDKSGGFPGDGTRNARSVWTIATEPSSIAHFAMMPTALAERCILAGSSGLGRCSACGARWRRITKPVLDVGHTGTTKSINPDGSTAKRLALLRQAARALGTEYTGARRTAGWAATCKCDAGAPVPDIVLDPFAGAGTTGLVADRLGRDSVLIELNPTYADAARARLTADAPLFAQVAA